MLDMGKGKGRVLLTPDTTPTKVSASTFHKTACYRAAGRESTFDSIDTQSTQPEAARARFNAALLAARKFLMPFGKHKGQPIGQVEQKYIYWLQTNKPKLTDYPSLLQVLQILEVANQLRLQSSPAPSNAGSADSAKTRRPLDDRDGPDRGRSPTRYHSCSPGPLRSASPGRRNITAHNNNNPVHGRKRPRTRSPVDSSSPRKRTCSTPAAPQSPANSPSLSSTSSTHSSSNSSSSSSSLADSSIFSSSSNTAPSTPSTPSTSAKSSGSSDYVSSKSSSNTNTTPPTSAGSSGASVDYVSPAASARPSNSLQSFVTAPWTPTPIHSHDAALFNDGLDPSSQPPRSAHPAEGPLERLTLQHKQQLIELFSNGRMFALGPFLDTIITRTKVAYESGMVDFGRQFNDNTRRVDSCMARVDDGINGITLQLRANGPAVQQGLLSLGEGVSSLHEIGRQTSTALQGLDNRIQPLADRLQPLTDISSVIDGHSDRVGELEEHIAALHVIVEDEVTRFRRDLELTVPDKLRRALADDMQNTIRTGFARLWDTCKVDLLQEVRGANHAVADLIRAKQELETTKQELESAKQELESTKEELENTKNELETTKHELEAAPAVFALVDIQHQQALAAQAATSAIQTKSLQQDIARLTVKLEQNVVHSARIPISAAVSYGHVNDLTKLMTSQHEQALSRLDSEHRLKDQASARQIIQLRLKLGAAAASHAALLNALPASSSTISSHDVDRLNKLVASQHQQTIAKLQSEHHHKEKDLIRQNVRLKLKLAAADAKHLAHVNTPSASPAPLSSYDVEKVHTLLDSQHQQALSRLREQHKLKEKASTRQIIQLKLKLAVAAAKHRVLPTDISEGDVEAVIKLMDKSHKQAVGQQQRSHGIENGYLQKTLDRTVSSQEKLRQKLDSLKRKYSSLSVLHQDKERKMHTCILDLRHALFLIHEKSADAGPGTIWEVHLIARRGLDLVDDSSEGGNRIPHG